jgi:two-component system, LytTR family, sensor kinase
LKSMIYIYMWNRLFSLSTYLTIAMHLVAWGVIFVLPFYNRPTPPPGFDNDGRQTIFIYSNIVIAGFFYLNAYVLIPKILFLKKNWWRYTLVIILAIIFVLIIGKYVDSGRSRNPFIFPFIISFAFSSAYRFFLDKMKEDRLIKERETENLKTELTFLRSQISPHFMFNTLNSLVSLARKKSDLMESILIKLSNLIRYMIYESETKVSLETEMEYLQSYIELQKMRFGDKMEIIFNAKIAQGNFKIEPMILISFVENAFKHGVTMIHNPKIEININVDNKELHFSVWNRHNNRQEEVKDKNSGIGVPNIKRRLNLLYGSNHNLVMINNEDWFMATLKLKLDD